MKTFALYCLFLLPGWILSQNQADCATALEICNKNTLQLPSTGTAGLDPNELNGTCAQTEFSSTWITWTVVSAGNLTFTITPDILTEDIDFVVFKLAGQGNCTSKTVVRCMAAGENVGQPFPQWAACSGATGLSVNETDVQELPGCTPNSNNFLAALECLEGETYALAINNFTNSGSGFTISFCGTALLGCDSFVCNPLVEAVEENLESEVLLYPNPVSGDWLNLEIKTAGKGPATAMIFDARGVKFLEKTVFGKTASFDVGRLPAGMYFLKLDMDGSFYTGKFVKR